MKRSIFVLALIVFLVSLGTGRAPARGLGVSKGNLSDVYILAVGIDKYENLPKLQFAVADAVSLAEQLESRNAVGEFQISQGIHQYLNKNEVPKSSRNVVRIVLKDSEVTPERIGQAFDQIAREIGPEDVFFFSYSGMGAKLTKEFSLLTQKAGMTSRPGNTSDVITTSDLQALFRKIRARNKLIVLDSCDSSAGYDALASAFIESDGELRTAVGNKILLIGTEGLTSESRELGHGALTQTVLDGLRGDADFDGSGVVSASELEAFVYCGAMKYRQKSLMVSPRTVRSGDDFNIGFTEKKREELTKPKPAGVTEPQRSEPFATSGQSGGAKQRDGDDYALLFANSYANDPNWNELKNPINDVNDIAKELRDRYGFKEVVVKENLTSREIRETLTTYQAKAFPKPDDQLFIFFAGHGVTERVSDIASNSYYVGSGSPRFSVEDSGRFMQLDSILQMIAGLKISHVMTVFDTCFAGQIWKPAVATYSRRASIDIQRPEQYAFSFGRGIGRRDTSILELERPLDERLIFAKRTMASQSRIVLTSGNRPVQDAFRMPDGSLSRNSPFANKLLGSLREGGRNYKVLTANEIYIAVLGLPVQPMVGQMGGTDGDFVFVER